MLYHLYTYAITPGGLISIIAMDSAFVKFYFIYLYTYILLVHIYMQKSNKKLDKPSF